MLSSQHCSQSDFFHHSHAQPSILAWAQDCSLNPGVATGLWVFRDETQLRKRCAPHRFRRIFRAKSEAKAKSENRPRCRAKSESRPRWKNPDLGAAQARQAGGSDAGQVRRNCRIRQQFRKEIPGKNFDLGAGSAGLRCRAGAAGRRAGMWRARRWASPCSLGEPSDEVGREPVLIGRARTHWANPYWASHQTRLGRAIKRGWGEPSNEVGRASTKGPLGEPLNFHSGLHACFKAAPAWRGA